MIQNPPILSPRLKKISDLIPKCNCFADIGTDHAYLPVYLCMKNVCKSAIASDINTGPLSRAKKTITSFGMEDRISTRLGGGFETLNYGEVQAVSVAGMGGLVIAKILEDGRDKITSDCTVILQPMTAVTELREYIYKNNWTIECEDLAREEDKIYNIISVKSGRVNNEQPSLAEIFIGKYLADNKPEHYDEYISKKIKKLENMIKGLENSETNESKFKLRECMSLVSEVQKLK